MFLLNEDPIELTHRKFPVNGDFSIQRILSTYDSLRVCVLIVARRLFLLAFRNLQYVIMYILKSFQQYFKYSLFRCDKQ